MSFSRESLNSKLASLQDTQESIVSISQWVFFHHRHSKECAQAWSDYLLKIPSSPSASGKKLCLLYLCNDVVQRAKRKRKPEFIEEFAAVLPNVITRIYSTLDSATRPKLDRLINVWQERAVFSSADITKMRNAVESTKSRSPLPKTTSNSSSNTSANSGSIAPELKSLNDLFLSLNRLTDISQSNLTQFGIQSKTYLPVDPSKSDNLPAPKVYISKLNMLEKLSKLSIMNIEELKNLKSQIAKQLEHLSTVITEQAKTDNTKISIINDKLGRLYTTRDELQSMLNEEETKSSKSVGEEPSPSYDNDTNNNHDEDDDDDDDILPTYETDDDDTDEKRTPAASGEDSFALPEPATRKRRSSQTSSGGSTPSSKKVAFSEDIEVKEFDREEETDLVHIESSDGSIGNTDDDAADEYQVSSDFELHHKDDLELKHGHDSQSAEDDDDDDDGYDPSETLNVGVNGSEIQFPGQTDESSGSSADVMSLLSKLA